MIAALQTTTPDLPGWTRTLLLAMEVVNLAIGLFIVYTAYRGYRRNESRPMLFIALGFFLVLGVPTALYLLTFVGPRGDVAFTIAITVSMQLAEMGGYASILYALRMRR